MQYLIHQHNFYQLIIAIIACTSNYDNIRTIIIEQHKYWGSVPIWQN